jgi:predicted ester cyclase
LTPASRRRLEGVIVSASPQVLVERFYHDVWMRADESAAHDILEPELVFRGSLGVERRGVDGFLDYVRAVHGALADYTCTIEDLVTAPGRAAARVRFAGRHRGPLLGVPATGRRVAWTGAAFFTLGDRRIRRIWVLGDLDALKAQLGVAAGEASG